MRKFPMLILALAVALPISLSAKKKTKPLPMPPATSHGQAISNYACYFTQTSQVSTTEYWDVVAFAEYGKEHKRYWTKSLGTYRGSAKVTGNRPESAGSGQVIGEMTENVNFGQAGDKCTEWKTVVYQMLQQSKSK